MRLHHSVANNEACHKRTPVTVLRPGNGCPQTLNATFSQEDFHNPLLSHPFDTLKVLSISVLRSI